MDKFTALLVIENLPILVGVFIAAMFARFASTFVPGLIIGLIFGLAAYVGMEVFGMEHVHQTLGGGDLGGGGSLGGGASGAGS